MKKVIALTALCSIILAFPGCRSGKAGGSSDGPVAHATVGGNGTALAPKATVFRMNGDYAGNVAVTLNPDGTLAYYPAPSDISEASEPYDLGDGWYLNRQGISPGSVFTRWTFADYAALPQAPSPEEIIESIIPGAKVVVMEQLPISASIAVSNPAICKSYIKDLKSK